MAARSTCARGNHRTNALATHAVEEAHRVARTYQPAVRVHILDTVVAGETIIGSCTAADVGRPQLVGRVACRLCAGAITGLQAGGKLSGNQLVCPQQHLLIILPV